MKKILFCGDTLLTAQAAYLAGIIAKEKFQLIYIPSHQPLKTIPADISLLILSDYPAKNISKQMEKKVSERVESGLSFWMIGGWESFHGLNKEYTYKLNSILPVTVSQKDDRLNSYQPLVLQKKQEHMILKGLPWAQAPMVGGLNIVKAKKEAKVLLEATKLNVTQFSTELSLKKGVKYPLLIAGSANKGKTLALTTDLAPHWCGGFVDWGNKRITAKAKNSEAVEVGSHYYQFVANCLHWLTK